MLFFFFFLNRTRPVFSFPSKHWKFQFCPLTREQRLWTRRFKIVGVLEIFFFGNSLNIFNSLEMLFLITLLVLIFVNRRQQDGKIFAVTSSRFTKLRTDGGVDGEGQRRSTFGPLRPCASVTAAEIGVRKQKRRKSVGLTGRSSFDAPIENHFAPK